MSLAPTKIPGNCDAETSAIDDWLDDHADDLTEIEREAIARLVFAPFEVTSIEAACVRVTAIVRALATHRGPSRAAAMHMFDDVIQESLRPEARS
jgi:hypothetical protein